MIASGVIFQIFIDVSHRPQKAFWNTFQAIWAKSDFLCCPLNSRKSEAPKEVWEPRVGRYQGAVDRDLLTTAWIYFNILTNNGTWVRAWKRGGA